MSECRMCGDPLPVSAGPGRKRRYCGEECRRAAEMELRYRRRRIVETRGTIGRLEERIRDDEETIEKLTRK